MYYFKQGEVRQAKEFDLLSYFLIYEPNNLINISKGTYCTREHDSLKISNGMWYWFSRGIGGRSALDYLIKVKGIPFTEAVGMILGRAAEMPPVSHIQTNSRALPEAQKQAGTQVAQETLGKPDAVDDPYAIYEPGSFGKLGTDGQLKKEQKKELLLPKAVESRPERVIAYLVDRGIDRPLIEACINHKLLYESAEYHNAVFVGYDREGVARYAAIRGTMGSYKGEATGSDKRFSFSLCLPRQPPTVHVFESAIDLLSYATLEHRAGRDWRGDALLSLAGVFKQKREKVVPVALAQFLSDHPSVKTVCLHLDNDEIGRSAAKGIIEGLSDQPYEVINQPPSRGKDVNDQLLWELNFLEQRPRRRLLLPGLPGLHLPERPGRTGEARLDHRRVSQFSEKARHAAHPLPRPASLLRQPALRQRRRPEGHPGLARSQRHRHHQQHLHPPQLQLQGELRPGHPGLSSGRGMRLVRLPMRKMTSMTSESPPAQAGQSFREFGFPEDRPAEVRLAEVRLASADAAENGLRFP